MHMYSSDTADLGNFWDNQIPDPDWQARIKNANKPWNVSMGAAFTDLFTTVEETRMALHVSSDRTAQGIFRQFYIKAPLDIKRSPRKERHAAPPAKTQWQVFDCAQQGVFSI